MKIHNKLEVRTKDKTFTSFNNLLFPFVESLSGGGSYSKFLAYGVGETQSDPVRLGSFSGVVELVTESHNFDPSNGTLFIRKKWVLDENDKNAYEFVEVGLTPYPDEENPKIANRFLVNGGEPIYRDPGEEMAFEITIYLEFDNASNLKLTAGSNALVKFLLGDGKVGEFFVARGYDTTPNDTLISRSVVGLEKVLSVPEISIVDSPPGLSLDFSGELSAGDLYEFLLIMGDEVIARQNVQNVYGGSSDFSIQVTADADNYLTLKIANIDSISGVTNLTTGEDLTDYSFKAYGDSFYGGVEEIFAGLDYQNADKVIVSKQQDKIAFIKDNVIKIYSIEESGPVELDASYIDVTDGYLYLLFADMFFVKCAHPDGTYSLRYYHRDGSGVYKAPRNYMEAAAYETVRFSDYWYDIDGIYMGPNEGGAFMFIIVSSDYIFGIRTIINSQFALFNNGNYFVSGYITDYAVGMEKTNRLNNCIISYDANKDRMVYRHDGLFKTTNDTDAINIVKNYRDVGYPKAAKNYAFSVDNADKTIKLFSVDSLTVHNIAFENAERIMVDDRLDYAIVRQITGGYKAYYIDASRNLYEFVNMVPNLGAEISKMYVIGDYFVFFLSDGRIVRLGINKNKTSIYSVPMGNVAEITLRADVTPGQDGNPIGYSASVNVSASEE